MRCRMVCVSFSAPSAVWMRLMPSWALLVAWFRPRIWARSFSEMARPAASSAARLIRRPEDRRSRLVDIAFCVPERLR